MDLRTIQYVPHSNKDFVAHAPPLKHARLVVCQKYPECPCAVERRRSSVGAIPTWQLLLQSVAIGAVVEVTIDWREPNTSTEGSAAAGDVACQSEERVQLSLLCVVRQGVASRRAGLCLRLLLFANQ